MNTIAECMSITYFKRQSVFLAYVTDTVSYCIPSPDTSQPDVLCHCDRLATFWVEQYPQLLSRKHSTGISTSTYMHACV